MGDKKLTEYQISLMRTCDDCEHRTVFNMKIDGEVKSYDWCGNDYFYIRMNTIFSGCSKNVRFKNVKEPIKNIIKRKWKSFKES